MPILKIYRPPITYMPFETSLMSILMGEEGFSDWINSNMIQVGIKILPDDYNGLLTPNLYFLDKPYNIEMNAIPIKLLIKEDISYYINVFLKNGYYLFLYLDKYFLPNYSNYRINHDVHSLLVYGMNKSKIYIADFFRNGKFTFESCSLSSINKAVGICQSDLYNPADKESDLLLLKPLKIQYEFCVNTLVKNLESYLNCSYLNGERETKEYDGFGMKNYLYIYSYLESLKNNIFNIDYRIFSFHLSHKLLLLDKIKLLCQFSLDFFPLINEIKQMIHICKINKSLSLKYNVNKNKQLLTMLIENIYILFQKEKRFIQEIIVKCNDLNHTQSPRQT